MANASLSFLAWVREGAARAIKTDDAPTAAGVTTVAAKLTLNDNPLPDVSIRLRGPADVLGIDPNQIIRTDPHPGAVDFESNCFPSIEFDRPDFPWLFTPTRANVAKQLRPWLCLVVVKRQAGVTLTTPPGAPLPVLRIAPPAVPSIELPDLSDAWAWAHAQVANTGASVADELAAGPERSLSRLICPRILAPQTDYIACLAPTFEVGRLTGLGKPAPDSALTAQGGLAAAWQNINSPPFNDVSLPVYYHWEFRTGEGGDFEAIARGLTPDTPAGLGLRPIDISKPGFNAGGATTTTLQGALRPVKLVGADGKPDADAAPAAAFQTNLAAILNSPDKAQTTAGVDPVLAPPLYGRWHAAQSSVTAPATAGWFNQLNLDPRWRAVAALGTEVVQVHQEPLMASAWEQAADLPLVNQRLRQLQLSRAVGEVLHGRHFARFNDETMLRVAAPAMGRLGLIDGKSLLATQAGSPLPMAANGSAMRRIGRRRGPMTRRIANQRVDRTETLTWVAHMMTPGAPSGPDILPPPQKVFSTWPGVPSANLAADSYWGAFFVSPDGGALATLGEPFNVTGADKTDMPGFFRAAALKHIAGFFPARQGSQQSHTSVPTDLTGIGLAVLDKLDPKASLAALARATIDTGDGLLAPTAAGVPVQGLETVMAAPHFPSPMYEALRDISQDLLLPGLGGVKPETVLGLQTNRRFVESYMVGLNHEMGRELLWRGFPTDQRGTYFRNFWALGAGAAPDAADIDDIPLWKGRALGASPFGGEQFVMLLKSRLLARYPNALIYMTPATGAVAAPTPSRDAKAEKMPIFNGAMKPDLSFFGFPVTAATAVGGGAQPGWYVVIQEHPTEPRFGIDFGAGPAGASHLKVGGALPGGKAGWGKTSSQMAQIFQRRPARVAIHAARLIAPAS